MNKKLFQQLQCKCNRCGHAWLPRIPSEPRQCPGCHSCLWNKPRVRAPRKKAAA